MKKVLITGASSGLGIKLSKYLLEKDYFVILHYFNNGDEVNELHNKYKDKSYIVYGDLTNEDVVKNIYQELLSNNIKVDVLINNAAVDHTSEIEEKTKEDFINTYLVNTYAPFLMIKYFGEYINEVSGSIINISSDNTLDMYDEVSLEYDLSKAGLNMLTKIFARKYDKAHINAILFGWLDTKMNNLDDDMKKDTQFVPFDVANKEIEECINTDKNGVIDLCR